MSSQAPFRLGLIVRTNPYAQRSARTQMDIALLAATLDWDLRLYFVGAAVLQLIPRGDTGPALLAAGYRAWASLPDLLERAEFQVFAEPAWLDQLHASNLQACLPLMASSPREMRRDWVSCDRLLVL
ncbi:MAG: DsrE family protein [Xanthomonadales bacterium]|nr:DsrE family protein [Xanthomonadales bacterium]